MLSDGAKLGRYEIIALLGAGGMGEVYRARDPRMDRDVAIKILPATFSTDPERLRRFEQEARAAGALNHPNLITVHELGTHDGGPFIVSELLEGETLHTRLSASALPLRRTLDYAMQIARGLAAAHEKGIVHRDLKPENLFITRDGRVKILDFGLAKLKAPREDLRSAAPTDQQTHPGTIVGTAGYMSPEQVSGLPVDHRSDLFSFGSIVYEMITGRQAFQRSSGVETMNAVLKEEPPELSEVQPTTPPALDRVIRHCLEKHPEARFQSARDLAFDLEAISDPSTPSGSRQRVAAQRRRLVPILLALIVAAAIAAVIFYAGRASRKLSPPTFRRLTFQKGFVSGARFAPDGQIVYSANWSPTNSQIFTSRLDSPEARPFDVRNAAILDVAQSGDMLILVNERSPGISPGGTLARMPLAGGAAPREVMEKVRFADADSNGTDLAIVRVVDDGDLLEWPVARVLYKSPGWIGYPRISPARDGVAFVDYPRGGDDGSVAFVDRSGKKTVLAGGFLSVRGLAWSPDGREVWFAASRSGAGRSLHAVDRQGKQRPIFYVPGNLTLYDIAADGRVLVVNSDERTLVGFVDRNGVEHDLSWLDSSYGTDISEDGKFVLVSESGEGIGSEYVIYLRTTDGAPAVKVGGGFPSTFSRDGRWFVANTYPKTPAQLLIYPTGPGSPRQVTHDSMNYSDTRWFPDGRRILTTARDGSKGSRVYEIDLATGKQRLLTEEGFRVSGGVSPDQKLAEISDLKASHFLLPLDGGPMRPLPETLRGLGRVRWSADGQSIYFSKKGALFPDRWGPTELLQFDLATKRLDRVALISKPDSIPYGISATPDGKSFIYNHWSLRSDLYLATGLE
ncbi:MAG TPA: protein kinase [Thermoanaerobaculia bacterium]|jgi:serine/threonine protein kinase/Tol biopolymer transport system component|nr:protein kinase [Thermoanaerobaculia bacterium]